MLVGYRVHGIRRPQDLTSDMARDQARNGWLTDAQYLAILANPDEYQGLRLQGQIGLYLDNVLNGPDECFFICEAALEDSFQHDVEDTYGVTFDVWRMTVKSCYSDLYEKREYTMRNSPQLKLVHYQPNNDADKLDKVRAIREANDMEQSILEHGQSSGQEKQGVLQRIRGRRGGRRGRRGPN